MIEGQVRVAVSQAEERQSRQQRQPQNGTRVLGEPGCRAVGEKSEYPREELRGQADANTKRGIESCQQARQVAKNGGRGERVRVAV